MENSIIACVLGILTSIIGVFTFIEARKSRIQNLSPQISVYFLQKSSSEIELIAENTSSYDARDVYVQCLNNKFYNDEHEKIFQYSKEFTKKFSYIPSGQKHILFVGNYNIMRHQKFSFRVLWRSMQSLDYISKNIFIDMAQFKDSTKKNYSK